MSLELEASKPVERVSDTPGEIASQVATVLVVDDDPHIREVVSFALRKEGYTTQEAGDGKQALRVFEAQPPDLIVLDIMMPELDGTELCRQVRKVSSVPIVFLTSKDEEIDRIVGLEIGADDYVSKPFSPRELVARVKAVLRRFGPDANPAADGSAPTRLEHGRLKVDLETHQAHWGELELDLTVTEFGILRTLIERPGRVYSRDQLMDRAYPGRRVVSDRTIDSHVRRLRAKLRAAGIDPVQTVHGVGYRLGPL